MHAKRHTTQNFEAPTPSHAQALFQGDTRAWKQVRANSGISPEDWSRIDQAFMAGFRTPTANAGATANAQGLEFEEWEDRDGMAVQETQHRLTAVDDLLQAGLVRDTSLARLVSVWQAENDFDEGEISMDGRSVSTEDRTVTAIDGVPLPIVHVDFEISQREQANSENFGESLDTQDARKAGRVVREDLEDLVFNGWGNAVQTSRGSFTVEGYTNATNRLTPTAPGAWDDGTNGAQNVLDSVRALLDALEQQGPNNNEGYMAEQMGAWLYIPTARWGDVTRQSDPEGDGNMSLRQRIEQDFPYIDIRHAGALDGDETVMVVQSRDVVDLADAQAPTTQAWDIEGGFATRYKSLACRVPRVKSTFADRSGIAHMTGIST